jgi:hypothetical protein
MIRTVILGLLVAVCAVGSWAAMPIGAIVQSSEYDAEKKAVTVHILNTSQKDITAISLTVRVTNPDGTVGSSGFGTEFLDGIVASIERGHEISPGSSHGIAPGGTFVQEVPQSGPVTNPRATVEVVIYADGTADVLDETQFREIVMQRKGEMLAIQRADELIAKAIADPTNAHPSASVAAELKALAKAAENNTSADATAYEGLGFKGIAQDLDNAPKDPTGRSAKEDNFLRRLITIHEKRVSLILPHTAVREVRP